MFTHVKFSHLPVSDQDRALAFYTGKIGLTVATDTKYGEDWRWIELAIGGSPTRILFSRRPDEEPGKQPALILITNDVDAEFERLTAAGVEFTQKPSQAPWMPGAIYALFRDSENNLVMIGSQ